MIIRCLLLVYAAVFLIMADIAAAKDDFSDFYNDLVIDLGPFLSLFGESMTKQYLSESTTWCDYLIFAMGPIGILTTVISVIRCCGYSWLKAFVGRSQEGTAIVEAELCTSTSRDVCELYNHGGIARVLGRPKVLELVYIPQSHCHKRGGFKEELQLFRDYLQQNPNDHTHWRERKAFRFRSWFSNASRMWPSIRETRRKTNGKDL
ncbi:ankyrin repeat domain-containing protein 28 [Colletotrichum scovillei]|uniref:Ankyrin repeat domain-containing protein 28 n=1 Tax=Colletotrichum scovillei TaxID=1209932 RepID=A0A9P7RCR2_9PEZI|nr:ankyrin repeat domain-containing protein 28 [Colletotrichum scovillei]KAG7074270.1 ankyrin repeat domain-containing protein 28 [Colletotrichum scovillei]KAG7081094.1 ankyrin repeat domain-containing protein 28 [Colletotrichum scovillei]